MPELHYVHDTSLATRRGGIGPLQCMWSLPQAPWHASAYITQNGRDQESQSCQNCGSGAEAKGDHKLKCAKEYILTKGDQSRCLTVTACPHLNQRVLPLQIIQATSQCPTILGPIDRILPSRATKPPLTLPTLLHNMCSTVPRQRSMHSNLPRFLRSSCVIPRRAPPHLSMTATWNHHRHTKAYFKRTHF